MDDPKSNNINSTERFNNNNINNINNISPAQPVPITQGNNIYPQQYIQPYPQPYPQPIVQPIIQPVGGYVQPTPIIVNQAVPTAIDATRTSRSCNTFCPYCQRTVMSISIQTFNCTTCLCFVLGCICFFLCVQAMYGKDYGCYDAIHKCPLCGQTIATYKSC